MKAIFLMLFACSVYAEDYEYVGGGRYVCEHCSEEEQRDVQIQNYRLEQFKEMQKAEKKAQSDYELERDQRRMQQLKGE